MNIVLIGYRGTGKSAVGRLLAERLGMRYIGMDARIVEKAGRSIPEIVEKEGWGKFRDLESEVAREVAGLDNAVIDTGGGIIERPENIEVLKKNGKIFWLKASVETIVERIGGGSERPSLTGEKSFTEEVSEVLARRVEKYLAAAEFEIETEGVGVEEIADKIVKVIGKR